MPIILSENISSGHDIRFLQTISFQKNFLNQYISSQNHVTDTHTHKNISHSLTLSTCKKKKKKDRTLTVFFLAEIFHTQIGCWTRLQQLRNVVVPQSRQCLLSDIETQTSWCAICIMVMYIYFLIFSFSVLHRKRCNEFRKELVFHMYICHALMTQQLQIFCIEA